VLTLASSELTSTFYKIYSYDVKYFIRLESG